MKQIIQDLKKGDTILEEVPAPQVKSGHVLIKTTRRSGSVIRYRAYAGRFWKSQFY